MRWHKVKIAVNGVERSDNLIECESEEEALIFFLETFDPFSLDPFES